MRRQSSGNATPEFRQVRVRLRAMLHEEARDVEVRAVFLLLPVFAAEHRHRRGEGNASRAIAVEPAAEECRAGLGEFLRLRPRNAQPGVLGKNMDEIFPCACIAVVFLRGELGDPKAAVRRRHASLWPRAAERRARTEQDGKRRFVGIILLEPTG